MKKIIAVVNQSGGAGKTTLSQNIGYHLGLKNRVLLVDMDPQASLTAFMGLDKLKLEVEQNIYGAITDRVPIKVWNEPIHGVYFIPTNQELSSAELEIMRDMAVDNRMRLKIALEEIADQFDYAIIDCPPSLSLLSIMSLVAATHVVIPLETQYKCYKGTDDLFGTIARVKKSGHKNLEIACIVPNKYEGKNLHDKEILEEVTNLVQGKIHVTEPIPKSTAFANASKEHVPLALYKKSHPGVKMLQAISDYLEKL
ncbi:Cobyrinic acid a,c-diamide synthase (plasmid) [Calothrix sp. PCC 7716]|nr:Cobyrinic acid a,c-diamide synthase [Calothrix sp. PCC 7716]